MKLLLLCEEEYYSLLGMSLNVKKSACIRVGARFNIILIALELLPNKDVNYHGLRLYVTLGYTWFQHRPLNVP